MTEMPIEHETRAALTPPPRPPGTRMHHDLTAISRVMALLAEHGAGPREFRAMIDLAAEVVDHASPGVARGAGQHPQYANGGFLPLPDGPTRAQFLPAPDADHLEGSHQ